MIVFREGTYVLPISGVFAPGASATWFDMELKHAANWCKWQPVVVEWAVVIGVC